MAKRDQAPIRQSGEKGLGPNPPLPGKDVPLASMLVYSRRNDIANKRKESPNVREAV